MVKPAQPKPEELLSADRPSVHPEGLCPKVQYLESWLTEGLKQIPGGLLN